MILPGAICRKLVLTVVVCLSVVNVLLAQAAQQTSKTQSTAAKELDSLVSVAEASMNKSPQELLPLLQSISVRAKQLKDSSVLARVDLMGGVVYARANAFDSALHVFQRAWEYGFRHKDTLMSIKALNNIAGVYNYLHDYDRSLEYNQKAIQLQEGRKDRFSKAKLLLSRGRVQNLNDQPEHAMRSLKEAAQIFKALNSEVLWLNTVREMGFASAQQHKHQEALALYRSVLPLYESRPYDLELIELNQRMAESYMELGQFNKALPELQNSLMMADSLKFESAKEPALQMLVEVAAQLSMADLAVQYSQELVAYTNDMKDRNVKEAVEELEMQHQVRQKVLENEVLKSEALQRELELSNIRSLLIALALLLLVVGLFSAAIYRYSQKIKSLNHKLEILNADLEKVVQAKTARLEERNKQILATSFSLAHEIRSNVATALGAIELIKLESGSEAFDDQLMKAVIDSSRNLDKSVKELISRLEE